MNNRTNQRLHMQHNAKLGILHSELANVAPRMTLKPIIANISFGGMGLIFIPELSDDLLDVLLSGKSNVYVEFFLPPSLKSIGVTGKVKWIRRRHHVHNSFTYIGVEFITKTQELYREIDKFLKAPSPSSDLLKNQRFFPRVYVDINASFSISDFKRFFLLAKIFHGNVLNISAVGVLLSVTPPLKANAMNALRKNNLVQLKFTLEQINHPFSIQCRVVHMKTIGKDDNKQTILGFKFLNLNDKEKNILIEYVVVKRVSLLQQEVLEEDQ